MTKKPATKEWNDFTPSSGFTEQAELEAMGRSLLQDIVRSQTFSLEQQRLGQATSLEDLLLQSIEFETDTIGFYEFLAGFLDDPEAITLLNGIIEQERGHVRQLEQMRIKAKPHATSRTGW
jgi:rubrerythrin